MFALRPCLHIRTVALFYKTTQPTQISVPTITVHINKNLKKGKTVINFMF